MPSLSRSLSASAYRINAPVGAFLTDDEIRGVAPSVFATAAHESRSAGFAPIPTSQVLTALRREGFEVVQAQQQVARDSTRRQFNKHLLRMRHQSQCGKAETHPAVAVPDHQARARASAAVA